MLTSAKVIDAVNQQVGMEFAASLQYDAIGSHFAAESLPKLAAHFFRQATEERDHAHRFMKFVIDAGGRVLIPAIPAPVAHFAFAKDAVKLSYEQEIEVTRAINALADLAQQENDHITKNFLQWFLNEQLEEVSSMDQLLKIVERAGEGGLLMVEQYLIGNKAGAHDASASEGDAS
jgi:ferritin